MRFPGSKLLDGSGALVGVIVGEGDGLGDGAVVGLVARVTVAVELSPSVAVAITLDDPGDSVATDVLALVRVASP